MNPQWESRIRSAFKLVGVLLMTGVIDVPAELNEPIQAIADPLIQILGAVLAVFGIMSSEKAHKLPQA